MVVDHAFRVAGCARGVIERDRFPLVGGPAPRVVRVPFREELLVGLRAKALAAGELRILDIDDFDFPAGDRLLDDRRELLVGNEELRFAVLEHERDRLRVQARVERIEHRAGHGHAEMRFVHGRDVGQHHRDRVADADTALGERRGEPAAARVGLPQV